MDETEREKQLPDETDAVDPPDEPTDPEAKAEEPLTPEKLEELATGWQLAADLAIWDAMINQELGELSKCKILLRLQPTGDIEHPGTLTKKAQQHQARIRILKEIRVELGAGNPLPGPGELEVVTDGLVVARGVPDGSVA